MELDFIAKRLRGVIGRGGETEADKLTARQAEMASQLTAAGIDVSIIDQAVEEARVDFAPVVEMGKASVDTLNGYADEAAVVFRKVYAAAFRGLGAKDIAKGTAILAVVYLIQKFAQQLLLTALQRGGVTGTAATRAAFLIMAVVVAPMTEEYGRRLSHRVGAGAGFSVSLNVFEFVGATHMMVTRGTPVAKAVVARLVTIFALHKVAETIQQYFEQYAIFREKPWLSKAGYWVATAFHMLWNLVAAMITDLDAISESTTLELAELELF